MVYFHKAMMLIFLILAQTKAQDKNFKPVDEITGADTLIEQQLATMMTRENEFINLWREHKQIIGPIPPTSTTTTNFDLPPKVDFKKYVVVAYFGGAGRGIDGYEIVKVENKKDLNLVTIAPHFIGNESVVTNSFGMWVFPRPKNPVELHLVTGFVNGQPQTRKLGKFEMPKETVKSQE